MAIMFSSTAFAQGTATEAKATLDKAVAAVKADKANTLDTINKGQGGFLDRDLYVGRQHVANGSTNTAPRKTIGVDVRTLKDATGKVFSQDFYDAAIRSNHRGQLHVSKAGRRHDAGCKDKLGNQGRRSGLWRGLLQVDRS